MSMEEVDIPADFFLGVHEVTQKEWWLVMKDTDIAEPSHFKGDDLPVEKVSWIHAQKFIKRLNEREPVLGWEYRLPTSAEWEYACRGGASSKEECDFDFYLDRPTTTLSPEDANFAGKREGTTRVGSYKPNRLGLFDMHGNVREWCDDVAGSGSGAARRVIRGGGWDNSSVRCRAASRDSVGPADWGSAPGAAPGPSSHRQVRAFGRNEALWFGQTGGLAP